MKPNSFETISRMFNDRLSTLYPEREIRSMVKWVLEEITQKSFARLLAEKELPLDQNLEKQLDTILNRLAQSEPLQYVLGSAWFANRQFNVKPGVLIPRNETEELVVWLQEDLRVSEATARGGLKILDVGCGSGIIAITLALDDPRHHYFAVDKYPLPLALTKQNARRLGAQVDVFEMDILKPRETRRGQFDVVISNPPYVTQYQKKHMAVQVTEHEPESALFVSDEDPLLFYRAIADFCLNQLSSEGLLYLEINEDLSEQTMQLLKKYFIHTELRHDLHGKPRMIKAYGR